MTSSTRVAEFFVRNYLDGREMNDDMFEAAVWMVATRVAAGSKPILSEMLCRDIDSQAGPRVPRFLHRGLPSDFLTTALRA